MGRTVTSVPEFSFLVIFYTFNDIAITYGFRDKDVQRLRRT